MDAVHAVFPELVFDRCLDAEENAKCGKRTRVPASGILALHGKAGYILRALGHGCHVGFRYPHVFSSHVLAAQRLDRVGKGCQHIGRLGLFGIRKDHGLAAPHRQACHSVLVAHAAREAQGIAHGGVGLGIMPEASSARAGAQMGGMKRNDGSQAALRVSHKLYQLVVVVIRFGPESRHSYAPARRFISCAKGENGAIEGSRTPDLRYHKPAL